MNEIGLRDAVEAAYSELYAALATVRGTSDLRFRYTGIEMEFTVEVGRTTTGKGGVKFWVVEAEAEGGLERRKTHTVKLTIEPVGADGSPITVNNGSPFPRSIEET